jgi:hypothetical protein
MGWLSSQKGDIYRSSNSLLPEEYENITIEKIENNLNIMKDLRKTTNFSTLLF